MGTVQNKNSRRNFLRPGHLPRLVWVWSSALAQVRDMSSAASSMVSTTPPCSSVSGVPRSAWPAGPPLASALLYRWSNHSG